MVIRIPYARQAALPVPGAFSVTSFTPSTPHEQEELAAINAICYWSDATNAATYEFVVTPDSGTGFTITGASQTGLTSAQASFTINLSDYQDSTQVNIAVTARNASGTAVTYSSYTFSAYPAA